MTDPNFPLISDLTPADQAELLRIQAIPSAFRTATEAAYFAARLAFTQNFVLSNGMKIGPRSPLGIQPFANISFSGNVLNGETVTIGTDVYEFRTSGSPAAGHIKVDVSGGADPTSALAALGTAINAHAIEPVDFDSGTVYSNNAGTALNGLAVSTTSATGSWDNPTLRGGQFAILAKLGDFFFDNNAFHLWIAQNDITTGNDIVSWLNIH